MNTILLIPNKDDETSNLNVSQALNYKVVSGDNLYKISKKYGISIQDLERLNPTVLNKLPIGYLLILREEIPIVKNDSVVLQNDAVVMETKAIVKDTLVSNVETSNIDFLIETALQNP